AARGLEIQCQRSLLRVLRQEGGTQLPLVELGGSAESAGQVATVGDLHLDHIRAEERELITRVRSGEHVGQVEDPDSAERTRGGCRGHTTAFCRRRVLARWISNR